MPDAANMQHLAIHLDDSGKKVIAAFTAEGAVEAITLDDLRQAIDDAELGSYSLDEISMQSAVAKYNAGTAFVAELGKAVDGQFSIRISSDHLSAFLNCSPPMGGAPVQLQSILDEAKRIGLTVAIDQEATGGALPECKDVQIASGKLPEHGKDGRVEILIPVINERNPHVDKNGLADFRDLGDVLTVEAGETLARHIPPTAGTGGYTLDGKIIPAKPGKDVPFAARMDGVAPSPQDPDLLVATINGFPVLKKTEVSVEPVYTVRNVDLRTGNIDIEGTVHVTGDVHTGMTVRASGDIHVDGTVEGAILEAGGDIVIKGGILGLSKDNTTTQSEIRCKGSCTTHFAQNAQITAGNGIFIHDYAMQSVLKARHQILVGEQGSHRGDIIGGSAHGAMLLKAHAIGSASNVKTLVIAGADQYLHEGMKKLTDSLKSAEHKLADLDKLLELAHEHPERISPANLEAANSTRTAVNQEIETLSEAIRELQEELDLTANAQIVAEKKIHPGAVIRFGLVQQSIDTERQGGTFQMKDGELLFE